MMKTDTEYEVEVYYTDEVSGGEVCEGQENEEWPNFEDSIHDISIDGLRIVSDEYLFQSDRIAVDFDPLTMVGEYLFLVVVKYSSGGTFGSSYGHLIFPGCFSIGSQAEEMRDKIKAGTFEGHCPWQQYFERLQRVWVEVMELKKKKPIVKN